MKTTNHALESVGSYIRTNTILLSENMVVENVIALIRTSNISDQITYFYAADEEKRLVGVLPLRRLISARPEQFVREIMVPKVITLSENESLAEAQRLFNKHKLLSFPVVDSANKFLGVLDITVVTQKNVNLTGNFRFDNIFETIGIKTSILEYLTPFTAFRHRFPWLIPTLVSGIACAVLSSFFEQTIADSIVLAFFLTLILGMGESVSIQTLSITIRRLHVEEPTWKWYLESISRELLTAILLGSGVALALIAIVYLWKDSLISGIAIGISVILSLCSASFFGLSVPSLLHKIQLDPKIAAGPLALGLSDIFTLLFYFSLAAALL